MSIHHDEVPKQFSRKPDPSEPYRYITPCCETIPQGNASHRRYRCDSCGESYSKRQLIDQKAL